MFQVVVIDTAHYPRRSEKFASTRDRPRFL